jgi:signal transduction histidine kinase
VPAVVAKAEKVSILLVDDQPQRLLSYEAILRGLGQNLVSARSGTEALELLMKGDFAVILLDVSMPGMDGFETAAMIHNHPRYERTPIIFVTGVHVSELDRLKGYKLGAVDYVSIPIVADILRSKVHVLVELHSQRRQLQELNVSLAAANEHLERTNTTLQAEKTRELEVLNHALQEANRHKDEFLAILAHELRNPLAPIRNAIDIMKRLPMQDASLVWSRDVIGRQAAHLTRLVDDLLDISRITHGTIKLNRDVITVKTIVDRALEAVQPAMQERRHELQVHLAEPGIIVNGDLIRLVQVLGNLLVNAAKYTPPEGRIGLDVRRNGSVVEFRVSDSGIGISADSLPRLFNLFSRVSQPAGHAESGLGIGLALVRRLVELHDGKVSVRSDGENRGSEFLVTLPVLDVQEPAADEPTRADGSAARRRRILVVDDNLDALNSIALLLEMAGHEVFEASGGVEGLELAGEKQPDTAILDIGMPVMNGFELARRIRAEAWGKPMHLIALSGWGQQEDKRRAREAGFDHHLVKPVSFEAVSDLISRLPA